MDSQYRCKCGKPLTLPNEKCPDCGSLGPHNFMGRSAPIAESTDIPRPSRHRESYTPEYEERPQPPARQERYSAPPVDDIPAEARHSGGRAFEEDDSRFPAGMRSHSPILDHIRNLDGEQKETKKKAAKEKPREYEDRYEEPEERRPAYSYDGDEETEKAKEQPKPSGNGGLVSTIISIILVLALVIAAIYVINNYDEITKWLASPTVPEVFRPSAE